MDNNSNYKKNNWQKELLESGNFNNKFSKYLLEHGAKNFLQEIYLGYYVFQMKTNKKFRQRCSSREYMPNAIIIQRVRV